MSPLRSTQYAYHQGTTNLGGVTPSTRRKHPSERTRLYIKTHVRGGWNLQGDGLDAQHRWRSVERGLSRGQPQGNACVNGETESGNSSKHDKGSKSWQMGTEVNISAFSTKGRTIRLHVHVKFFCGAEQLQALANRLADKMRLGGGVVSRTLRVATFSGNASRALYAAHV